MTGPLAPPPLGHPAALAATRCGLRGAVVAVQPLEESAKSAVYRLTLHGGPRPSVILKRCDAEKGEVERTLYGEVLPHLPVGAPAHLGSWADDRGSVWLAVEDAGDAEPRLDRGDLRRELTDWAATLHRTGSRAAILDGLPDRSARHYLERLRASRADLLARLDGNGLRVRDRPVLERAFARCDELEGRWSAVEELCARVPVTLVHGDLVEENLRVVLGPTGRRLVALDWEKAGAGCPLVDLVRVDAGLYWRLNGRWLGVAPDVYDRLLRVGDILRTLSHRWAASSAGKAERAERRLARAMAGAALGGARPTGRTSGAAPEERLARRASAVARLVTGLGPPARVEVLKGPGRKSDVVRLVGMGRSRLSVIAKLCPSDVARVERTVYERVLPRLPVTAPLLYGVVDEPEARSWLVLEDSGDLAWSAKNPAHRALACDWFGAAHPAASELTACAQLPARGAAYYLSALQSARRVLDRGLGNPWLPAEGRTLLEGLAAACARLDARWGDVEDLLLAAPVTLTLPGFGHKNARVARRGSAPVLLPFDFENAGWGPPVADLQHVDGECYRARVRGWWSLERPAFSRLAAIGDALTSLKSIPGEAAGLTGRWPERSIARIRWYAASVDRALAALLGTAEGARANG